MFSDRNIVRNANILVKFDEENCIDIQNVT